MAKFDFDTTINDNHKLNGSRKSMGDRNSSMYKNIDMDEKQIRKYSYNDLLMSNSYLKRLNSYLQSRLKSKIERIDSIVKSHDKINKERNKYKQDNIQLENSNSELNSMHNEAITRVINLRKELQASEKLLIKLNRNSIPIP
jgi:hypothetical protein